MDRAKSRTRRGKRMRMVEGEGDAIDTMVVKTMTVKTSTGEIEIRDVVPMKLNVPLDRGEQNRASGSSGEKIAANDIGDGDALGFGDGGTDQIDVLPDEYEIPAGPLPPRRDQAFYMKEFVIRVDELLLAQISREARTHDRCGKCDNGIANWRCKECFLAKPLCRSCMRHTHMEHPFHRIEHWTGTYFESADLWQVGVYIRLLHSDSSTPCQYLGWVKGHLEDLEKEKDEQDKSNHRVSQEPSVRQGEDSDHLGGISDDADADSLFMDLMDRLYQNQDAEDLNFTLEEDDDHGMDDPEADVGNGFHFTAAAGTLSDVHTTAPPNVDAFNNKFVRIVHTNGVHHMSLSHCSCSGVDGLPASLMHAGFMPTSFKRVRTLFTLDVLDQFRYSNLEMKASAYQFFQMLRRVTMPMSPNNVINFYHELRRLSRLWRWMKKLKWAGFCHKDSDPMDVEPGELSIYCPACPQPGINLPEGWKEDPNRWVYRRFLVLDGNFKADHVRQKSAAPDIWLSDGGGMTTRRNEYKDFLRFAINKHTVSLTVLL